MKFYIFRSAWNCRHYIDKNWDLITDREVEIKDCWAFPIESLNPLIELIEVKIIDGKVILE